MKAENNFLKKIRRILAMTGAACDRIDLIPK